MSRIYDLTTPFCVLAAGPPDKPGLFEAGPQPRFAGDLVNHSVTLVFENSAPPSDGPVAEALGAGVFTSSGRVALVGRDGVPIPGVVRMRLKVDAEMMVFEGEIDRVAGDRIAYDDFGTPTGYEDADDLAYVTERFIALGVRGVEPSEFRRLEDACRTRWVSVLARCGGYVPPPLVVQTPEASPDAEVFASTPHPGLGGKTPAEFLKERAGAEAEA